MPEAEFKFLVDCVIERTWHEGCQLPPAECDTTWIHRAAEDVWLCATPTSLPLPKLKQDKERKTKEKKTSN